jgi:hypothetical protein
MSTKHQPKTREHHHSHGPRVKSHLQLVANSAPTRNPKRPVQWAIALGLLITGSLVWVSTQNPVSTQASWTATGAITSLKTAFEQNGIEGYLVAKARLREQVKESLQKGGSVQANEAAQVAVYLFADLLPDSDFEKSESLSLFHPLMEAIETRPRTANAGQVFEALNAEVWNYENVSREEPQITPVAEDVLRLFSEMSRL